MYLVSRIRVALRISKACGGGIRHLFRDRKKVPSPIVAATGAAGAVNYLNLAAI